MKPALIVTKVVIVAAFAWTVFRTYIVERISTIELALGMMAVSSGWLISVHENREHWRRVREDAHPTSGAGGDGQHGSAPCIRPRGMTQGRRAALA